MNLIKQDEKFIAVSTYDEREIPKSAGFRWDMVRKIWWTDDARKAATLIAFVNGDEALYAELRSEHNKATATLEMSRATDAAIDVPAPDGREYMPFQRAGIAFCLDRTGKGVGPSSSGVLIADEMGL